MAKMQIEGIEEYSQFLSRCYRDSDVIIKKAVYTGAGVVADAMKTEIKALPVDNGFGTVEDPLNVVANLQKADLIDGFGISPILNDGDYINAKLGWDGYNRVKTKKYPKGVPNQLIIRSINSGTSFRKKNPFVRRVINKKRTFSQKVMNDAIIEEIQKEMK